MRFIPLASARRIKMGQEVFTINKAGQHGVGKLIERKETEAGQETVFEVPQYFNKEKPSIIPALVTDITHVAFPVDRVVDEKTDSEE